MIIKKNKLKDLIKQAQELPQISENMSVEELAKIAEMQNNLSQFENNLRDAESQLSEERHVFEQTQKECLQHLQKLEDDLLDQIQQISKMQTDITHNSKPVLIDMAVKLAEKIIQGEVHADPKIIENMMEEAITEIKPNPNSLTTLVFNINPADKEIVDAYTDSLKERRGNQLDIKISLNDEISQGSCFVEAENGTIDLNFRSQLELFRQKMLGGN